MSCRLTEGTVSQSSSCAGNFDVFSLFRPWKIEATAHGPFKHLSNILMCGYDRV
jgi:hypothetical protein